MALEGSNAHTTQLSFMLCWFIDPPPRQRQQTKHKRSRPLSCFLSKQDIALILRKRGCVRHLKMMLFFWALHENKLSCEHSLIKDCHLLWPLLTLSDPSILMKHSCPATRNWEGGRIMRQSLLISHALTNSPSVARDVRRIGGRRGSVLKETLSRWVPSTLRRRKGQGTTLI